MKHFTSIIFLIIVFPFALKSQTAVSGEQSGTWQQSNSPYFITGNITINSGENLSVEAGTEIYADPACKIIVNGSIKMNGTAENPIILTAGDFENKWAGIEFINTDASNDSSVFEYCEINFAKAESDDNYGNGGAFYISNFSKIRISDSQISNCRAENYGAAVYAENSGLKVFNTDFIQDTASYSGGAVYITGQADAPAEFAENLFHQNSSDNVGMGGALYAYASDAHFHHNVFSENSAENAGGAIFLAGSEGIVFENNEIFDNYTFYDFKNKHKTPVDYKKPIVKEKQKYNIRRGFGSGGAVQIEYGSGFFQNNHVHHNHSTFKGGGILLEGGDVFVNSNLIEYNSAGDKGGGLAFDDFNGISANNTIIYNSAENWGDGIAFINSSAQVYNFVVLYNNGSGSYSDIYLMSDSQPHIYNSSIAYGEYGYDDDGSNTAFNLTETDTWFPAFSYAPGAVPVGLQSHSALINKGYADHESLQLPDTDIEGRARISDGTVDIGCFEYEAEFSAQRLSGLVSGTIEPGDYYIMGDLEVADGTELVINSGVNLYFCGNFSINVNGSLQMLGKYSEPVILTTADTTSFYGQQLYNYGGWEHIFLNQSENCVFEHVEFSYSKVNNRLEAYFTEESVNDFGGFIYSFESAPEIRNCSFRKTLSLTFGGAIAFYNQTGKDPIVENSYFSNCVSAVYQHTNSVGGEGGAIFAYNSNPKIAGNLFINNATVLSGIGGGYPKGGAIALAASRAEIINNTILYNYSTNGGGIILLDASDELTDNICGFYNNIIRNNQTESGSHGEQVYIAGNTEQIGFYNNNIQSGQSGFFISNSGGFQGIYTDNMDTQTIFENPSENNYALSETASEIDAGYENHEALYLPNTDFAGNPRINNNRIDIGAYEYQQPVGICDNNAEMFLVYPNPTNGKIFIQAQNKSEIESLQVYNLNGKKILHKNFTAGEKYTADRTITFDISDKADGIYFLKIKMNKTVFTHKITKN